MIKIDIKPLSVNECWQGRRFKNLKYKHYETEALYKLPKITLPEAPYTVHYLFGFSSVNSDVDNAVKPFTDVLQKKYGFNDRDIMKMIIEKQTVKKGQEYIKFKIESY